MTFIELPVFLSEGAHTTAAASRTATYHERGEERKGTMLLTHSLPGRTIRADAVFRLRYCRQGRRRRRPELRIDPTSFNVIPLKHISLSSVVFIIEGDGAAVDVIPEIRVPCYGTTYRLMRNAVIFHTYVRNRKIEKHTEIPNGAKVVVPLIGYFMLNRRI